MGASAGVKLGDSLGRWVFRWRWPVIIAGVALVAAAGSGASLLTFNNDTRAFFSEENPQLQALEALEDMYSKQNSVYFVLAPDGEDVFTREVLAAVEGLTEAAWKMPYSERVNSITNYQHTQAVADELIVEDFVEGARDLSESQLDELRKIALAEPLLVHRLVSPSGHVTAVHVNLMLSGESLEEVPAAAAAAREMANAVQRDHPDITVYLAGSVISDDAFGEASRRDMAVLTPIMILVLVLVVGFALRSFLGTLSTLAIIVLSTVTAMGLAGWAGISITSASANAPNIILTLAVADSVHILTTVFRHLRLGKPREEAIAASLGTNLQPVFLTSATTAIGFSTMNFSDAPPFRDLGNIVTLGVAAAFVYSVLLLPALIAVLPLSSKPRGAPPQQRLDGLADFLIRRPGAVLWGASALIIVVSLGITRVELYDDFMKYFSKRYEIRRATDFLEDNLTGANAIEYSLESGEGDGISDPAYLTKVEEFADWYRGQAKVVHVSTITTTLKRLNKNMHGDQEAYFRVPERRDLAAQYLLLYEMSLPTGLDLSNELNAQRSASRMIVSLKHANTLELREIDERARTWLRANAPQTMFTYGSGVSIIWAHISKRNINSMLGASFGALALISMLLIIALRSWKLGLLSLIPNLVPAVLAFGIWGLFVGRVGLGHSIIVAMTLGIVVDDSVHFLSKYLHARRDRDMDPPAAVRYAIQTVGPAMSITTVALVAGFMVLAFSGYRMNSDMGLMAAMTIMFAFAMDIIFLPALLLKTSRSASKEENLAS